MFSDTPRLAAAPATRPATRSWREKPIPKGRSRLRRKEGRGGIVSFRCRSLGLGAAFEGVGNSAGIGGELDTIQVTWSRQLDNEFLLHSTRMRGKKKHWTTTTNGLANVGINKNIGFASGFPEALKTAIKLLAGLGIEGGEGLIQKEI